MSGKSELPVKKPSGIAPTACRACHAPFADGWPRSKWTLTGYSPWCPSCDALHAPQKERRGKPGPKPKGAVRGGWTNMPIQ